MRLTLGRTLAITGAIVVLWIIGTSIGASGVAPGVSNAPAPVSVDLSVAPSSDEIAEFQTIDKQIDLDLGGCNIGEGIFELGISNNSDVEQLYENSQNMKGACDKAKEDLDNISFPAPIDDVRAAKLKSAVSVCAEAMDSYAVLASIEGRFLNGDQKPSTAMDIKIFHQDAENQLQQCASHYTAGAHALGFQTTGLAASLAAGTAGTDASAPTSSIAGDPNAEVPPLDPQTSDSSP